MDASIMLVVNAGKDQSVVLLQFSGELQCSGPRAWRWSRFSVSTVNGQAKSHSNEKSANFPWKVSAFSKDEFFGVADGARTHDNRNHNPGLYQLSYSHH